MTSARERSVEALVYSLNWSAVSPAPTMNRSSIIILVRSVFTAGAFFLLTACASATNPPVTTPPLKIVRDGAASGFDKRDFPGLTTMQTWMRESPYVWVGYYLQSPCYAGAAWTGNRAALEAQGWGLAVLYVGQQAPGAAPATSVAAGPDCGVKPLTADQGAVDGEQAVAIATADGFPARTAIFLDVERADPFPTALGDYVRGWIARVLSRGYIAGVYTHKLNAEAISRIQRAEFASAGVMTTPPFWVANSVGFDLGRPPSASGYSFATVWQTPSDASETWGGVTFRIDRNVATTPYPSKPY
jgi:hypothetical protein